VMMPFRLRMRPRLGTDDVGKHQAIGGVAYAEIAVIVQIEHVEAVKNIDAILDVPGIDGVFVGPFDMSGSMDLPGQINHPQVQEAIRKVIKACEKRDIARCIYAHTPKHATAYLEQGYRVIGLCTDYIMLARTAAEYLGAVRG